MALIETNFIRPQEVYDRNTGESKVRYRSYDGDDRFIPVVEGEAGVPKTMVEVTHAELKAMRDGGKLTAGALYRITDYNCTTTQENTQSAGHQFDIVLLALSENKLAEEGWAMMHDNIYDVTFNDGVTKKCYIYYGAGGGEYNIVDVETLLGINDEPAEYVTINENTKTAIIDEESSAMAEDVYTYNYFQNSNLSAWKVWYCLDNDKSRFAWADTTTGKGVIYRLIDEFNNDIKYDFKNIQFKRWAITALTSGSDEMKAALIYDADENPVYFGAKAYGSPVINGATLDDDNYIFAYTFDGALKDAEGNITHYDVSAAPFVGPQEFIDYMIEQEMGEGIADFCYDNFIGNYGEMDIEGDNLAPGLTLPNNVFFNSSYCYFDEDEDYWSYAFANCYGNSLKSYCSNNTFGNMFQSNTFGNGCQFNTFGNNCYNNTFGNNCGSNTFGNSFYANTFGNGCGNNTFGNYCSTNTFGNNCARNTFGNGCCGNTFGNDCGNNTFGNYCTDSTFGNSCQNNTFGNSCGSNTFGNSCLRNTFGNNAEKCSVGDGVQNITVSKDFMRYVIIENGNQKITITSNKTTSSSAYLQNFLIALGVNNSNNTKTISHNSVGDAFRTVYQNENSTSVDV